MTACKYVGLGEPRVLPGRHEPDCDGDCAGCQPCTRPHCVVCHVTHIGHDQATCGTCIDEARENLRDIEDMHAALRPEAITRGRSGDRPGQVLGGDAMVLLAMTWREQTGAAATDHRDERDNDPYPPLLLLGTWEDCWRDHLGHEPVGDRLDREITSDTAELAACRDYLDRNLSYMAHEPTIDGQQAPPFADFARDLRQSADRLRGILHDTNAGDRANVGCFDCGGKLERRLVKDGFEDVWTCARCRRRYTYAEYNFALRAALEASA